MHTNYDVVDKLIAKSWHISFAESCTGGLAAAKLVDVPNASRVLSASFITYSEEAKQALVGVKPETLAAFGVVSEEVAAQMAEGAAKASASEVGVGITGVAGPAGGTADIPVGTVCFGFYVNQETTTATCCFRELDRQGVRNAAVDFVFETLSELL